MIVDKSYMLSDENFVDGMGWEQMRDRYGDGT